MFVCEHWLKPSKLFEPNNTFKERGFWCNLKYSVPADQVLIGRPFGGVGFVCRKIQNYTVKEISQEDNKLSVIQLINNKKVLVTLIGVYLPYLNCASLTPQYNETLDKSLAIAETVNSPIILLGDMNAYLPQQNNHSVNWYKQRPFNKHSVLLHDLLSEHSMLSANLKFKQSLSYTYFNYTSRSYIDHIPVSENIYDNVISCAILPHNDDNLSDHLHVKVTLNVVCDNVKAKSDTCNNDMYSFPKIDWSNTVNQTKYLNSLSLKCTSI